MRAGGGTAQATSLTMLLHGLRRHWVLAAVSATLTSAAFAAAAWVWFTPEYSAFALLRIRSQEPTLLDDSSTQGRQDFLIYKNTQKQLIVGPWVLRAALRSPDVERLPAVREEDDPVAWLEKRIYVEFPGEAEIMKVSFSHADANTAAAITNAVTKAYMREVVDRERIMRMDRLSSLEKVFNEAEQKMRTKQTDLKRLAESLGTGDGNALSSKQQITLQHFATLRNEHTRMQFELMRAKINLTAAEEEAVNAGHADSEAEMDEETLASYVDQAPELLAMKRRMDEMTRVIDHNEGVMANGRHPRLVKQREVLAEAQEDYTKRRELIKTHVQKEMKRHGIQSNDPRAQLKRQVAILREQESQLAKDVEKYAHEAESIGRSSIDVEMMRLELKQIEDMSAHLGKEIDELRVEIRSPSRITELSTAEVPKTRDTVGHIRTTSIVALLGFLLPFVAISLWDARSKRVNTALEIADGLGMRIVAALPSLPASAQADSRRTAAGAPTAIVVAGIVRCPAHHADPRRRRSIAPGRAGHERFERRGQNDARYSAGPQLRPRRAADPAGRRRFAAADRPPHFRHAARGRIVRSPPLRNPALRRDSPVGDPQPVGPDCRPQRSAVAHGAGPAADVPGRVLPEDARRFRLRDRRLLPRVARRR